MTFKLVKNKNLIKRNLNNEYIYLPKDIIISKLKENIILNGVNIDSQKKEINYIDISCVINNKINSYNHIIENFPSRAKRIIKNKDTIVSSVRPNLKCFAYIDEKFDNFVCSTGFVVLSPVAINDKFLYYLFKLNKTTDFLVKNCTGGTYPAFNSSTIGEFEYINFNLNEQKVIANILLKQESVISNIEKLISKTEKLFDYFKNELLSGSKIIDFENMEVNSIDSSNKLDLKTVKLSDIVSFSMGNTPKKVDDNYNGDIPWITISNLKSKYINNYTAFVKNSKSIKIIPKDTLIGSFKMSVGKFGFTTENCCTNEAIIAIKKEDTKENLDYLYYLLPKYFNDNAEKNGQGIPLLNSKKIKDIIVNIPELEDQNKIVDFLKKYENLIENQKKLLEKEKQKFEWLSEKLLSGEYLVVEEQE